MQSYSSCGGVIIYLADKLQASIAALLLLLLLLLFLFLYPRYQCSRGRFEKLVKIKRLGMSKIPCGHKRAYCHVEEQR